VPGRPARCGVGGGNGGEQVYHVDTRGFPDNFAELQSQWNDLIQDLAEDLDIPVETFSTLGSVFLAVIILIILIAVTLWALATISHGGLIAGVNGYETTGASSFLEAWRAGWQKGWRLIGIGLVPAIPNLILFLVWGGVFLSYFVSATSYREAIVNLFTSGAGIGMAIGMSALMCMGGLVAVVLDILRTFANRACMIEDATVFEAYGRGWQVLRDNIAEVILLFLIQVGIRIVLVLVLFWPGLIMVACCFLSPFLLVIEGAIKSYFSTLWTLAWREWTGRKPVEIPAAEETPAAS